MYEYIIGTIQHIYPSYIVLEANGIGYKVLMANPFRLTDQYHKEATVYMYQDVRQDAVLLFGFPTLHEKTLFLKLINVSGIGPKSALAILANENHRGLIQAIEEDNTTFLTKFPGVGKKTAAQIVLDLKGKLSDFDISDYEGTSESLEKSGSEKANRSFEEALEALEALGYSKRDISKVEKKLDVTANHSTDTYIREALKLLM